MAEGTRAGLRRGAAAGPGRRPQAADDPGESGIGPEAVEEWHGSPGRRSESRAFSIPTLYRWLPASSRPDGGRPVLFHRDL